MITSNQAWLVFMHDLSVLRNTWLHQEATTMFFDNKKQLLADAEATIKQQQDVIERYKRHYDKQQNYIEGLYDVVGDLARQLGSVLDVDNLERLKSNPHLKDNSNFFLDLSVLFNSKIKKGQNVTCYFGKELADIRRKFQDRDFKDSELIHLTERFTLDDLRNLFKNHMWKKSLKDGLETIRRERKLDSGH
jgi:hypothetical protein